MSLLVWSPVQNPGLKLYLKPAPDTVDLDPEMISDVRNKGHWGTGDVEIVLRSPVEFDAVKGLIERSYREN